MEATQPHRITFNNKPDSLQIIIAAKGNLPMLFILMGITIFWWFTGGDNLSELINKHHLEPLDWVWMLWGIAIILIIIRNLWAALVMKEKITFKQGIVAIKKQGNPFVLTQTYELAKIKYFSVDEDTDYSFFDNPLSNDVGSGTVCFGYDRKNIRFGEALSEADANYILQKLKAKGLLTDKNF